MLLPWMTVQEKGKCQQVIDAREWRFIIGTDLLESEVMGRKKIRSPRTSNTQILSLLDTRGRRT